MLTVEQYLSMPYTMVVRWDEDDSIYVARIKEVDGCSGHGDTPQDAIAMLRDNFKDWIEICLESGTPLPLPEQQKDLPSGKWVQRVPRSLHKKLVELAESEGRSLNQLVTGVLAEAVGSRKSEQSRPAILHALEAYSSNVEREGSAGFTYLHYKNPKQAGSPNVGSFIDLLENQFAHRNRETLKRGSKEDNYIYQA